MRLVFMRHMMIYHFNKVMKNKIEYNICDMCGTKFKGKGSICSQECEIKITELYYNKKDNDGYHRIKK